MKTYDVAILGSGLGGTILGAILARHGLRVLILESAVHPRFAIGESTIPETTFYLRMLAARYGVPEIGYLSNHQQLLRHVGSSHGVKRNFSFVWHAEGQAQRPHESTQYPTAAPPMGPDVHLFRQDSDAWMLAVAMRYGCELRQQTRIDDIDFDASGVRLGSADGHEFRASYLVDAGGLKSALAHKFGLRLSPDTLRTRSRALFTHMLGVRPYDAIGGGPKAHDLPSPLSQGTLHHIFDGGWLWVIPFNNHPSCTNPLCSVGLLLDIDRHPADGSAPESEFWRVIGRYPDMARQLEGATAIRGWMSSERLQFTSSTSVGDRWCMLPHAFAFVDPLYSSGLAVTMSAINGLAARLILAQQDGDWSGERFRPVDSSVKASFRYYDRLVSGSYTSWRQFPLWNAWTRLWMIGGLLGAFSANELTVRYRRSSDPVRDDAAERYPYRAVQGSELKPFAALFDRAEQVMDAVRSQGQDPQAASDEIFALIGQSGLWPSPWGPLSPKQRHTRTFTMLPLYRNGLWLRNQAPEELRPHYYALGGAMDTLREAGRDLGSELLQGARGFVRLARDYVVDANQDWRDEKEKNTAIAARSRKALERATEG